MHKNINTIHTALTLRVISPIHTTVDLGIKLRDLEGTHTFQEPAENFLDRLRGGNTKTGAAEAVFFGP